MCRCVKKPAPFKIGDYTIYGTGFGFKQESAVSIKGFDVVVLLDRMAGDQFLLAAKPWKSPKVFAFTIRDMSTPDNMDEFTKLLDYLAKALENDQKVLIGCIGGHGRTGIVLAALYHYMTGQDNGAVLVRETYCKKAIESKTQINWLVNNYNQTPVTYTPKTVSKSNIDWLDNDMFGNDFPHMPKYPKKKSSSRGKSPSQVRSKEYPKLKDLKERPSFIFDKTSI